MNNATVAGGISVGALITVIGVSVLVVVLGIIIGVRRCVQRKRSTQNEPSSSAGGKMIYAYLQGFDVEDIDLRRAPTGGWHGTYCNHLAQGVNTSSDSSFKSTTSDNSDGNTFVLESSSSSSDGSSSSAHDDMDTTAADDLVDQYINSYTTYDVTKNHNENDGIMKNNYYKSNSNNSNTHRNDDKDLETGRRSTVHDRIEKRKSLLLEDAIEPMPLYYGLSSTVDTDDACDVDDDNRIEHRPWRMNDDTI